MAEPLPLDVRDGLVVARSREHVANLELRGVPLGRIFRDTRINLTEGFSSFLENVFDVLEDNALDRPVVNLSELIISAVSLEIDDQAAAEAVLNLDHAACHDTALALSDALSESGHHLVVFEPVFAGVLKELESILLVGLLLEGNGEDDVLHRLEQLGQSRHAHSHLTIVVLRAVHGLEQLFAHLHRIAVLVADGDHARDVQYGHVARHGQVLVRGELSQIPLGPRPLIELLSDGSVRFLGLGNRSFRSCGL